jgi:oligoendopeptidase F
MESRAQELWSRLQRAQVGLRDGVARCDDGAYAALRALPDLNGVAAALDNRRARAGLLLPRAEEALACDLARDGLNAWGQLYDRVAGTLTVTLPDGETLSGSQVRNAMGSADRGRRRAVSAAASSAWAGVGKTCAAALSHIVGARQVLNDRRGVDEDLAAFRAAVEGAESQIPS